MTIPPMGAEAQGLWMTVEDIFHIKGRGTVLTGQLRGDGLLNSGDTVICDDQSWRIGGIEQFRAMRSSAAPGASIGVLLRDGPPADVLRGRTVQFVPAGADGTRGRGAASQTGPLISPDQPKKRRRPR